MVQDFWRSVYIELDSVLSLTFPVQRMYYAAVISYITPVISTTKNAVSKCMISVLEFSRIMIKL